MTKKQEQNRFHAPFAKLKERLPPPQAKRPSARPAPPPPPPLREPSDDDLWLSATQGVQQLSGQRRVAPPTPPPIASSARPSEPFWHPDLEAIQALESLVSGDAPFDLADTDEYIEGRVPGLDQAIVRRLRRGEFAVQGHIDLHGLTREEAKRAVEIFLRQSRTSGKRCVLLVHGRGIHSKDQVPILKEALRSWLANARFGRHVLAFATARPTDGGAGALYVLLRRAGR